MMERDELFQFARWLNVIIGAINLYLYSMGGGYHLLGLGMINVSVWVLTRKVKLK